MSRIALTADEHARGKDLPAFRAQLAAMVDECNARGVDLLAIAGDIFDNSAIQDANASTGAIARAVISELYNLEPKILMIPGNHDAAGSGSADALHVFADDYMGEVVREPSWQVFDFGLAIYCVPWDWSGAAFPGKAAFFCDEYERIEEQKHKTLLLAHVQVGGAVMNGGQVCQATPGKFQISREDLAAMPFDRFALGDFHKRQDLTGGRGGYVGALRQCNFGEEGNPAGFEIWDTETGAVEWIELDAAPRHKTFILAPGDASPPERPEGWLYKVRLTGAQPDLVRARDLERDGHVVEVLPELDERLARAEVPPNVINDPRALMALWTDANDVDGDRLAAMLDVWDGLEPKEKENSSETA